MPGSFPGYPNLKVSSSACLQTWKLRLDLVVQVRKLKPLIHFLCVCVGGSLPSKVDFQSTRHQISQDCLNYNTRLLTRMVCHKMSPEDKNHTLCNHHSKAFSEPKLSWERRMSLMKRNRKSLAQQLLVVPSCSNLNTGCILKPRQKLKISEKGAALLFLTHIPKAPVAPDSSCPLHTNAGWEAITHSRPGRYKYTCFLLFPSQPQTFPQANNEGARTAADAQCATPQGDLSLPALKHRLRMRSASIP